MISPHTDMDIPENRAKRDVISSCFNTAERDCKFTNFIFAPKFLVFQNMISKFVTTNFLAKTLVHA
jgi:hypothetical protein